ncbi:MAG: division/cell wall cluster transcriptional repressor MraZ [Candidatus Zixiibacteriota bacterium]
MSGFYGQYRTTLDDKGRVALPAKLRAVIGPAKKPLLEGSLILTKGLEGCLSLFPEPEWESIQSRLSTLPFTKRDFRYFSRWFYSMAAAVSPDRSGRILIPSHLIVEAGLKKELLVIGVNRWVEVWDPDRFQYFLKEFAGRYEDVAERLFMAYGEQQDQSRPPAGAGG